MYDVYNIYKKGSFSVNEPLDKFRLGKAGEFLTGANLILKGFDVSQAGETLPYDLLLDTGEKILKVQVKTTETYRTTNQWRGKSGAYVFGIKRKGYNSKKRYGEDEVDVFALVALDTMQVGYLTNGEMPTTINVRVDELKGQYHDEKGVVNQKNARKLHSKGLTVREIKEELGLGDTSIRNYLKDDFRPHQTKAKYMSDLDRDKEWFLSV